jgi:Flp pilus assembly protein CpaB
MKRNIVPLLGIAFVVAIVSTGVFYGLFAGRLKSSVPETATRTLMVAARNLDRGTVLQPGDLRVSQMSGGGLKESYAKPEELVGQTLIEPVQEGEPISPKQLASGQGGAGGRVPAGLRAVSVHVSESAGVVALLKPGVRVDVQAVTRRENSAELKTILQNVEVLGVSPQPEAAGSQGALPVVTLLTKTLDADVLALADSAARIRLALRNPSDGDTPARRPLALAAVFSSSQESSFVPRGADTTALKVASNGVVAQESSVSFRVQVLDVTAAGLVQLEAQLTDRGTATHDSARLAAFRPGADGADVAAKLAEAHEAEVLTSANLTSSPARVAARRRAVLPVACRVRLPSRRGRQEQRPRAATGQLAPGGRNRDPNF